MNEEKSYEDWWDALIAEQTQPIHFEEYGSVKDGVFETTYVSPYNVGDVIVGEIVEEQGELT